MAGVVIEEKKRKEKMKRYGNWIRGILIAAIGAVFCVGCATMQGSWQKAGSEDTLDAYEQFLKNYPEGEFTARARNKITEISYKQAKEEDTIAAYEDFLKKCPDNQFLNEVGKRIKYLRPVESEFMQVNKNSIVELESFLKKYKTGGVTLQVKEAVENIKIEEIQKSGPGKLFKIPEIVTINDPAEEGKRTSFTLSTLESGVWLLKTDYSKDLIPQIVQIQGFGTAVLLCRGATITLRDMATGSDKVAFLDVLYSGSVIRFKGEVLFKGITFKGEEDEPLVFILLKDAGLVYVTGRGQVILRDGREVKLPVSG